AAEARLAVCDELGAQRSEKVGPHQALNVAIAAYQWHLRDHALDAPIDRADDESVAAGVTRTPHADTIRVDLALCACPGDRVAIVAHLRPWIDFLARLAVAGAEVAVVKYHCGQSSRAEVLGVAVEIHLLDRREPMRHHDHRRLAARAVGRVEP